jgi:hypothetical protein
MPGGVGGRPGHPGNDPKKGSPNNPNTKSGSTASSDENSLLAQIMMAAQRVADMPTDMEYLSQLDKPQFDPTEFLAAKQGLDSAYDKAEAQQLSSLPYHVQNRGAQYAALNQNKTTPQDPGVIDAQRAYDEQLRIRRADALNVDPTRTAEPVKLKQEVDKISWDDYNNMTTLQRAAVDYNTMLYKAAKRDRRMQDSYDPNDEQMATYTGTVNRMFGDSGGLSATTYAPETVALLNQIGYEKDGAGNLDDFLNLDAAIRAKDLKRLDAAEDLGLRKGGAGSLYSNPVMEERMDFLGGMAEQTLTAQSAALEKGNALLARFSKAAFDQARTSSVEQLGGLDSFTSGAGFGEAQVDENFRMAFDMLADKNLDPGQVLYALQNEWSDQDRKKFVSYAQKRLITAEQESLPVTDTQGLDPRSAIEVAKILKLKAFGQGGVQGG